MPNIKKVLLGRALPGIWGTMIVWALVACRGESDHGTVTPPPPPVKPVARVQVTPAELTLLPGEGRQLSITALDANAEVLPGRTPSWRSTAAQLVTVDELGRVAAVAEGMARVIATVDGVSGEALVIVRPVPVARVVVSTVDLTLETGEEVQLTARVEAADGTPLVGRFITWASSAPHVAMVAANGRLRAIGTGSASITIASEGIAVERTVTVLAPPMRELAFDRVSAAGNELFVRSLDGTLTRLNAGNVSRHPSFSPDGERLVFAVSQRDLTTNVMIHDLFVVDRNGMNVRQLTRLAGVETDPVWSPDGTRIAFAGTGDAAGGGTFDIYVVNVDGSGVTNLTPDTPFTFESQPAWSPDGSLIAFESSDLLGGTSLHVMRADGRARTTLVPVGIAGGSHPTWSPDGERLAFARSYGNDGLDLVIVSRKDGTLTRLAVPGDQADPVWSPDGRHFAFAGRVGEVPHVFTMSVNGSAVRARAVGRNPSWLGR